MLISKFLSPNKRLQACSEQDQAHVQSGDRGDFVELIQQALAVIDHLAISESERAEGFYGPSTAAAVLDFKTDRQIINRAYQTQPDNIVGKMTIKSLDDEMFALEKNDIQFFAEPLRNARGHVF